MHCEKVAKPLQRIKETSTETNAKYNKAPMNSKYKNKNSHLIHTYIWPKQHETTSQWELNKSEWEKWKISNILKTMSSLCTSSNQGRRLKCSETISNQWSKTRTQMLTWSIAVKSANAKKLQQYRDIIHEGMFEWETKLQYTSTYIHIYIFARENNPHKNFMWKL